MEEPDEWRHYTGYDQKLKVYVLSSFGILRFWDMAHCKLWYAIKVVKTIVCLCFVVTANGK